MDIRRSNLRLASTICAVLLSTISAYSHADLFNVLGDHEKLKDQTVLAVGTVSEFSRPLFSQRDPSGLEKETFYKLANFCFPFDNDLSGKAALLLIDGFNNVSLAEISTSISQIKVTIKPITTYDCTSIIKQEGATLKRQLQLQLQRSKEMMEMLKKQQQR